MYDVVSEFYEWPDGERERALREEAITTCVTNERDVAGGSKMIVNYLTNMHWTVGVYGGRGERGPKYALLA